MKNKVIYCECPFCHFRQGLSVPTDEWEQYEKGALAQDALVSLTPTQRESIISGLCPECQKEVFGDSEVGNDA